MVNMPPALSAEIDARKYAEEAIMELLTKTEQPLEVNEVIAQLDLDESTVRRAILRLAASSRAIVDPNFNLLLPKAA